MATELKHSVPDRTFLEDHRRLPLNPERLLKTPRFSYIGRGVQGFCVYDTKLERVIKFVYDDYGSPALNAKRTYYYHKLAGLLFPGQVLQYQIAANQISRKGKSFSAILISDKIKTTPEHRKYLDKLINDNGYYHSHYESLQEHGRAQFLVDLSHYGIVPDEAIQNFDVINSKPFLFEIGNIKLGKLTTRLEEIEEKYGKRTRKLIEMYIGLLQQELQKRPIN